VHFVTMAHQLAWMEHPVIWLCASCAILWLVLRVVRSPLVRTGVLLMLCGLGMNALVTDSNAGSMPVVGMPATVGMLLAPSPGEETRSSIVGKVHNFGEKVRERFSPEVKKPATSTEGT
jgi:hypothetical protein